MCSNSVLIAIFMEFLFLCFTVVSTDGIHTNESNSGILLQTDDSCILPPFPQFGQWSIVPISTHMKNTQLRPGDRVSHGIILGINCEDNYKLEGYAGVVCVNAKWTSEIGRCLKKCPPLHSTPTVTVTCTYNITQRVSCEEATDGTRARFICADFYEDLGLERQPFSLCFNGKWSRSLPECVPICGQKIAKKSPTLIVKGRNVTRGEYPWQVALYDFPDKNLICGGSLLNQRVVLTAAHCVTDENNKLLPKELFMLAVGKYFRNYDDPRDKNEAQFSPVFAMYIPENYKGDFQNFLGDVAVIISKKTFFLSNNVQPVCIDWTFRYSSSLFSAKNGYVTGWGYTAENDNPSDVLKELKVPLIPDKTCEDELPDDYSEYKTHDKLCAGYLNSGTSVCRGDSGGGLVVSNRDRYYLIAIVSLSPQAKTQEGGCDSRQYALYTKISYYVENFVLEKEAQFRPYQNNSILTDVEATTSVSSVTATPRGYCILPQHPKSGRWEISQANVNLSSGMPVSQGTVLQILCNKGHVLKGQTTSLCLNGEWSPKNVKCLKTCPPLYGTEAVEITCTFESNIMETCENPFEGTIARQRCAPFYEDLQFTKNAVRVCRNGTWDLPEAECVPICGKKKHNDTSTQKSDYPWHAGLYRAENKTFVCSGALISQNIVLTAAHCVTESEGNISPKRDYLVAVGKSFRNFYNPLDIDEAQNFRIKAIFIPREYKGAINSDLGDVAVLVTENPVKLSQKVQPVCVDWGLKYETNELSSGYITGWGYTLLNTNLSETLRESQIQIVTREECSEKLDTFIMNDKLCAKSTSVCNGDPGGALVRDIGDRYYIVGVISRLGGCDNRKYALYTRMSDYNIFLLEKEARFKADEDCANNVSGCCSLPEYPESGQWSAFLYDRPVSDLSPGDYIASGGVLRVSCEGGYKLNGSNSIECYEGQWSSEVGHCFKVCPDVYSTASTNVMCLPPKGKELNYCKDAVDGTYARISCKPYYINRIRFIIGNWCEDGSWYYPMPRCEPVCGEKKTRSITRINGIKYETSDYPWQVAIYRLVDKMFICGGSLLNGRVILTAGHCVTDSKDSYIVAVGNYYRQFNHSREFDGAQFSELADIIIPQQHAGDTDFGRGDIAILVTKKTFILSSKVLPVCLESSDMYTRISRRGYVNGWSYIQRIEHYSEVRKDFKVAFLPYSKCSENVSQDKHIFLNDDTLCVRVLNKAAVFCPSFIGGSLVTELDDKYYVAGVMNVLSGPTLNRCSNHNIFFTKLFPYVPFIKKILKKFRY